ncbi:probable serine/threonine-protein kinase clkA isoform X2 [Sipha flava]|uniref:Probable serine/threonine-protein kinase clkA isoform X2 n=1 Tax=Sipha flava TaxID=143950 RepID=A0A8B8FEV6_9HEMI|nr:probable serine/threonine-protein kinase clkA isoform X2 [Sipha flava]
MWPDFALRNRHTTIVSIITVAMLFSTAGEVHGLKCRTTDHSNRQGEFIDLAEQCNNMTSKGGDRTMGNDYSSSQSGGGGVGGGDSNRRDTSRRNDEDKRNDEGRRNGEGGRRSGEVRRNNNREFSVTRQDFSGNGNREESGNNNYNRGDGYNRGDVYNRGDGYNRGVGYNRGSGGDRGSTSCDFQPQQYPAQGNYGDRQNNYRQGSPYYPSVDYDARQSNSNYNQWTRRNRRHANKNSNRRIKAATSSNRLLGNNRFRNVTKNGVDQGRGSILDKMDALNSNSRPDKPSIVNIMTNQIKDVELKEFLQDSIDECFDTLELDVHNNKCEFSKNFAMCMENKAQRNCDDWDESASSSRFNSAQDGNNQQDKKKGY